MKQVRLFSFAWGTWLLLAGALLLSAAGCTESTSVDASSGDPKDTGADPKDTGADPKDTGADPKDTGADPKDTGADPKDTDADPEDTGADPKDTGPEDTGTEPEDTGPEDTGPDPLAENGVACFADSECDSGFCADGVCCESSCDGDCAVCNAAGFEGTCTPHIAGVVCRSAVGECDLAEVCDGESFACPEDTFDDGALCGEASDCVTGGVCTAADTCELAFAAPGTECGGAPVGVCSAQSTCDGAGTCSPNFLGAETECRAAVNKCDVAEVCAGDSPDCPTDLFAEAGEPCGDGTFHSVCNLPDTCDGNGFCDANLQPTSVVCREAVDDCDAPEYCDGLGFCPADEVLPANTECRAAAGDCDIAAVCDGSSVVCPANDFVAAGEHCGGLPNGDCDAQNTCDGAGGCTENYLGNETVCRAQDGECDVAEVCAGDSPDCPTDVFVAPGEHCGGLPSGDCDAQNTCDGAGGCTENYLGAETVCRASLHDCDAEEVCPGDSKFCPDDLMEPIDTPCGDPKDTVCNGRDTCDGEGYCRANLAPDTTFCRAAAGDCDLDAYCDGVGNCPENAFKDATTVCREAEGDCDVAEYCTGNAAECPTDVFVAAGADCGGLPEGDCDAQNTCDGAGGCTENYLGAETVCRAQDGECDVAEVCAGDSPDCPTDVFVALGEHCGGLPSGDCDAQNTCDGAGGCTENYLGAETECRAASGECDVAEVCGGDSPDCPTDVFVAPGEHCGGLPEGDCDAQNTCDGAGGCTENFQPSSHVCRDAKNDCDAVEYCSGSDKTCPADEMMPINTACGDPTDDVCNKPDTCDGAGFCRANLEPITTECRAATGDCDVAEFCDGLGNCPDDGVVEYGWECRAAGGDCEAAAVCDGASKECPANEFLLPGEHCGGLPVGDCDAQNTCDGAGGCTVNFQPYDYECRGAAGDCDLPAFCTGSAVDCPPNALKPSTAVCREAEGACDVAEYCTGNDVDCPADVFVAPNEPCGDTATNTACDKPDTCDGAGVCQSNYTDAGVLCATHPYDEYRCFEEDMCGAEAQELVRNSYCDGAGACDEADDDEWVALETCDAAGQICEADEFGARCLDCDDSWADDDICLDEATVRSWFGDGECDANQCVNYAYVDTPCGVGEHCVDGACEALPTCSGQEYGGHCWFLADLNQSCDAACAAKGLAYDDATRTFAGVSVVRNYANKANCLALVKLFKPSVSVIKESGWDGGAVGCTWWNSGEAYINAEVITNSSATRAYHGRICACQEP